ncbi:uncharacterized protein BP01DRAFT_353875 [Aspergillus saccharolyticus JOP 1030-1]|uniref:Uncharacterized protein n=1 Tax=Aspergillus saccharolyticus JOP 1030-1 TaxID=1450539 RepID=A0A318ZVB1_9EURO|nr:hypothetical protein BP01DRAFT_353875 [Aspergillus saccharolyticus JOP 1030-1]PYH47980.1 hypothetical protein BP01DRAFT_353875 [Aspergillus saccharolyticus JOP 1030-1]
MMCYGVAAAIRSLPSTVAIWPSRYHCAGLRSTQETPARASREPVAQRIVGVLRRGQRAAPAGERGDLAPGLMDLVDGLHRVEVVDARLKANLVEDGHAGGLGGGVERSEGWGGEAGGDDGLAVGDGGLHDRGVVGVGDEEDDEVGVGDGRLELCLARKTSRAMAVVLW